jgi:hypothetical protein
VPRRGLVALLAAALVCALPAAGAQARAGDRDAAVAIYGGVGSWLDIFAGSPWSRPAQVVAALRAHHVTTFYVETSNYSQRADVVDPAAQGALLDAAHAAGIKVVAWYLPSFSSPSRDARRSLAAIRFRSATGQSFDSFALDIEASVVRNVKLRNARLLALARTIRAAAPAGYPLGAIIPSPVGMARHPTYWPGFPYAGLARSFDAFMPMAYYSYYERTAAGAYAYATGVVRAIRAGTGDAEVPIHLIGGIANDTGAAAVGGFARAAAACGVDGISLYAFPQTSAAEWSRLDDTQLGGGVAPACA